MTSIAQAAAKNRGNYPTTPEQDAKVRELIDRSVGLDVDRIRVLTALGIIEPPPRQIAVVLDADGSCLDDRAGTYTGARRHMTRKEPMCTPCKLAHREYQRRSQAGQRTK